MISITLGSALLAPLIPSLYTCAVCLESCIAHSLCGDSNNIGPGIRSISKGGWRLVKTFGSHWTVGCLWHSPVIRINVHISVFYLNIWSRQPSIPIHTGLLSGWWNSSPGSTSWIHWKQSDFRGRGLRGMKPGCKGSCWPQTGYTTTQPIFYLDMASKFSRPKLTCVCTHPPKRLYC